MKIIYIGKHASGGNDDEGAIAHSLRELGHEVVEIKERKAHLKINRHEGDFILFHKWEDTEALSQYTAPKVCWYFDLVDWPDTTLRARCRQRIEWMKRTLPLTNLMFCTDGDWVERNKAQYGEKIIRLSQGADERFMGMGTLDPSSDIVPILFTGHPKGGRARLNHVRDLQLRYGKRFQVVNGVHRHELRDLFARTRVVIAPDSPVTDLYWSNRVYLTLGFGGFLLHPYCSLLAEHYRDGEEIVFYRTRKELEEKIDYYLRHPAERFSIQAAGFRRTQLEHTYRHRVADLLRTVEEVGL